MTHASDAYAQLLTAMEQTTPACAGIDLFTADDLTKEDRDVLKPICDACFLLAACTDYRRAAKPTGGYWAGISSQKRDKK